MCDTLTALGPRTADGATLFAKNSDRERNEAQRLELIPAADHAPGAAAALTYIAVPQVARTHACLISRPFWMWGAEMGANEHGVAIGNEAQHSSIPAQRRRALTGMDLVRLGLERGASAAEAVEVITTLLERHGQGGDCGHLGRFYYHNGFVIADPHEAYVLETINRWWVVERVRATRSLSNALSIRARPDAVSAGLAAHARAEGWCDGEGRFDFAGRLIDEARDTVSRGRERCARGQALMDRRRDPLTPTDLFAILRDHGATAEGDPDWRPADTVGRTICMHAAESARRSQTVASMVSQLRPGRSVQWVTGASAPCLGVFKPVLLETGLPDQGAAPTDRFDPSARWWAYELRRRRALADYPARLAALRDERDGLERSFVERIDDALARDAGAAGLSALVRACWAEADAAEARWGAAPTRARPAPTGAFARSWARLNHVAGLPRA